MTDFERVVEILDEAVGGRDVGVRGHGAFWRGVTRDEFVGRRVFGLDLIVVGQGAASNLVKALKGEAPFGADLPVPPPDATIDRMPMGRPPVSPENVAFIERWIDEGCRDGDVTRPEEDDDVPTEEPSGALAWHPTSPTSEQVDRHDDLWFVTPDLGWVVNSNGEIHRTMDGGDVWDRQHHQPGVYLRCVGFTSESRGWVGTLSPPRRLLETHDGGTTWIPVNNLPQEAPPRICGLSVVNESVVYASGTNYPVETQPDNPPAMMKTSDGGATWTAWSMKDHASNLIDTYFTSPDHGWVVGGKADPAAEPGKGHADHVRAVVLRTEDGGETWANRIADLPDEQRPLGEWGWKIQFLNDRVGFVSLESEQRAAILKTTDGGETWERIEINDPQHNVDLEGVGFVDENHGWVGGWGPGFAAGNPKGFSSGTDDGGETWRDANEIGLFINRFRFMGDPVTVGYAAGRRVYKYSAEPPAKVARLAAEPSPQFLSSGEPAPSTGPVPIGITVPPNASRLTVNIWERFGKGVRQLLDEPDPAAGSRTVEWGVTNDAGEPLDPGSFILRVTVDDRSESRIIRVMR